MAFKIQTMLFFSTMFAILFLESAIYIEFKYLKKSFLYLVFIERMKFILSVMFIVLFIGVAIEFLLFSDPLNTKFTYYFVYTILSGFQIAMFAYGCGYIKFDEKFLKHNWINFSYQEKFTTIEKTLDCCGYSDLLMTASKKCLQPTTCKEVMDKENYYRQVSMIILSFSSLLFQVYNYYAIKTIAGTHKVKPSEFEDLIESAQ